MSKCGLILLLLIAMPLVAGAIEVQYSEDNATWMNVTHLNENDSIQVALQADTNYYFRAKNETAEYRYLIQKTKSVSGLLEGENLISILYFLSILLAIGLLVLAFWKQDSNFASFSAILFIIIGAFTLINGFVGVINFMTQALGMVGIGLGGYIFMKANIEAIDG